MATATRPFFSRDINQLRGFTAELAENAEKRNPQIKYLNPRNAGPNKIKFPETGVRIKKYHLSPNLMKSQKVQNNPSPFRGEGWGEGE
jgi:hypothetical protein